MQLGKIKEELVRLADEAIYIAPSIKQYDEKRNYGLVTDEELDTIKFKRWKVESFNIINELSDRYPKIYGELIDELKEAEMRDRHSNSILVHQIMVILRAAESLIDSPLLTLSSGVNEPKNGPTISSKKKVFIVHGHDESARESIARFLDKLNLEPIILHEQANSGRTIIEKLEAHSDVAFAIVILTPDDVGSVATDKEKLQPRARQNVIFELGYFISHLGRSNVSALVKGNVELPSDHDGVVYIKIDSNEGWKLKVAKELKGAGLLVDLNELV